MSKRQAKATSVRTQTPAHGTRIPETPTQATQASVPAPSKKKAISLHERITLRLEARVRPVLREAARALEAGTFRLAQYTPDLSATLFPLGQVSKIDAATIDAVLPRLAAAPSQRVPDAVVAEILAGRRTGLSKPELARAHKLNKQTVARILQREGDPAPESVREREGNIRRQAEINTLRATLGITDEQAREMIAARDAARKANGV